MPSIEIRTVNLHNLVPQPILVIVTEFRTGNRIDSVPYRSVLFTTLRTVYRINFVAQPNSKLRTVSRINSVPYRYILTEVMVMQSRKYGFIFPNQMLWEKKRTCPQLFLTFSYL